MYGTRAKSYQPISIIDKAESGITVIFSSVCSIMQSSAFTFSTSPVPDSSVPEPDSITKHAQPDFAAGVSKAGLCSFVNSFAKHMRPFTV